MKRSHGIALILVAAALATACGDEDMNQSIEEMNEGVELANTGQLASAETHLKKATSLAPENHQAWYGLGQVQEAQRKWKEAVQSYAQAVQNNPKDAMYRYRLGRAHYGPDTPQEGAAEKDRNLSEAQTNLEEAVKLNPKLYKAWFFLGSVYEAQDQPKKAAEAWTKSATLVPSFGKPFNKLGILYIKWDKLDLAIKVLENGLVKLQGGRYNVVDPVERSDIFYHLGLAYERKNQFEKAIEMYTEAINLRKDNIDARRQRGFSYAEAGKKDEAIKDLEAFVKSGGGGNAFQIQAANERLLRLSYQ